MRETNQREKNNFMSTKCLFIAKWIWNWALDIYIYEKKDIECSNPVCHDLDIYIGEYVIQMLTAINISPNQTEVSPPRNMENKISIFQHNSFLNRFKYLLLLLLLIFIHWTRSSQWYALVYKLTILTLHSTFCSSFSHSHSIAHEMVGNFHFENGAPMNPNWISCDFHNSFILWWERAKGRERARERVWNQFRSKIFPSIRFNFGKTFDGRLLKKFIRTLRTKPKLYLAIGNVLLLLLFCISLALKVDAESVDAVMPSKIRWISIRCLYFLLVIRSVFVFTWLHTRRPIGWSVERRFQPNL